MRIVSFFLHAWLLFLTRPVPAVSKYTPFRGIYRRMLVRSLCSPSFELLEMFYSKFGSMRFTMITLEQTVESLSRLVT
jgi:hypothetical protein